MQCPTTDYTSSNLHPSIPANGTWTILASHQPSNDLHTLPARRSRIIVLRLPRFVSRRLGEAFETTADWLTPIILTLRYFLLFFFFIATRRNLRVRLVINCRVTQGRWVWRWRSGSAIRGSFKTFERTFGAPNLFIESVLLLQFSSENPSKRGI